MILTKGVKKMSKYTTELRFICENFAGLNESQGSSKVDEIIDIARPKIFNFEYPIFDEEYKPQLEHKIIRHFYTREIGQETFGLFQLELNKAMNDIMPYYNELYKSAKLEFDPLTDVSYERSTSESASNSMSTSESGSTSDSGTINNSLTPESYEWILEQDTPQNQLQDVAELNYLTRATKNQRGGTDREQTTSTGNATSASELQSAGTSTRDYLESLKGYRNNNPSKLLDDYRKTILNIDLLIIGELEKLFFQLW